MYVRTFVSLCLGIRFCKITLLALMGVGFKMSALCVCVCAAVEGHRQGSLECYCKAPSGIWKASP